MMRVCLGLLSSLLLTHPILAAGPAFHAQCVGGTLTGIDCKSSIRLDLSGAESLFLRSSKAEIQIDYSKVNSIEYGQNVSRRYAEAILISPVLLLSKSRKHFVTLGYTDRSDKQQALVFRIHKGDIRSVLASLEARTGRRVEYQDDEARRGRR
jgi:hypothetical protein